MKKYGRAYAEINLDAILYNLNEIKKQLQDQTQIIGVIKADGYGHGAAVIGKELEQLPYLWGYAVASVQEGISLRRNKLKKPILILGAVFAEEYELIGRYHLTPMIFSYQMAKEIADAASLQEQDVRIHIKLDTGMNRLGFSCRQDSLKEIEQISRLPHIIIEGIYTHFAKADETDKTMTDQQLLDFRDFCEKLQQMGIDIPFKHAANSAAAIDLGDLDLNLVRVGIAMYGIWPSQEVSQEQHTLIPAMALKGRIVFLKTLKPNRTISYGATYVTSREQRIATVSVGYADGYPRGLSNKGYVLIRGQRAPICGRICMDQFMVDVTEIAAAAVSDLVTLLGRDGGEVLTIEELSRCSGRFQYELPCLISKRVPRIYLKDSQIVETKDYFSE